MSISKHVKFDLDSNFKDVIGRERNKWDFKMKLLHMTPDLYIANHSKLVSDEMLKSFDQFCASNFGTQFAYVVVDIEDIEPKPNFAKDTFGNLVNPTLTIEKININNVDNLFTLPLNFTTISKNYDGIDSIIQKVIVFKIAIGECLTVTELDFGAKIPENYDSIIFIDNYPDYQTQLYDIFKQSHDDNKIKIENMNEKRHEKLNTYARSWIKPKFVDLQVIPLYLLTIDFRGLRINTTIPICNSCEFAEAKFYCKADKAHFCETCDMTHHSANNILMAHNRNDISESPYIFGNCEEHPDIYVETVCESCNEVLCSYCMIIYDHLNNEKLNLHNLVSPFSVYKDAINNTSTSSNNFSYIRMQVKSLVESLEQNVTDCIRSFRAISNQLQLFDEDCSKKLHEMYTMPKLEYLYALKRQYLLEMMLISYLEKFWQHVQYTLPPGNYMQMLKRIGNLVTIWFSSNPNNYLEQNDIVINNFFPALLYQANTNMSVENIFNAWHHSINKYDMLIADILVNGYMQIVESTDGTNNHSINLQLKSNTEEITKNDEIDNYKYDYVIGDDIGKNMIDLNLIENDSDELLIDNTQNNNLVELKKLSNDIINNSSTTNVMKLYNFIWTFLYRDSYYIPRQILYKNKAIELNVKFDLLNSLFELALMYQQHVSFFSNIFMMAYLNLIANKNDHAVSREVKTIYDDKNKLYLNSINLSALSDPLLLESVGYIINTTNFFEFSHKNLLLQEDINLSISILLPFILGLAGEIKILHQSYEFNNLTEEEKEESIEQLAEVHLYDFTKRINTKLTSFDYLPVFLKNLININFNAFNNLIQLSEQGLLKSFYEYTNSDITHIHYLPANLLKNCPIALTAYLIFYCFFSKLIFKLGYELTHGTIQTDATIETKYIKIAFKNFAKQLHILARLAFIESINNSYQKNIRNMTMTENEASKKIIAKCTKNILKWLYNLLGKYDLKTPITLFLNLDRSIKPEYFKSKVDLWVAVIAKVYDENFGNQTKLTTEFSDLLHKINIIYNNSSIGEDVIFDNINTEAKNNIDYGKKSTYDIL